MLLHARATSGDAFTGPSVACWRIPINDPFRIPRHSRERVQSAHAQSRSTAKLKASFMRNRDGRPTKRGRFVPAGSRLSSSYRTIYRECTVDVIAHCVLRAGPVSIKQGRYNQSVIGVALRQHVIGGPTRDGPAEIELPQTIYCFTEAGIAARTNDCVVEVTVGLYPLLFICGTESETLFMDIHDRRQLVGGGAFGGEISGVAFERRPDLGVFSDMSGLELADCPASIARNDKTCREQPLQTFTHRRPTDPEALRNRDLDQGFIRSKLSHHNQSAEPLVQLLGPVRPPVNSLVSHRQSRSSSLRLTNVYKFAYIPCQYKALKRPKGGSGMEAFSLASCATQRFGTRFPGGAQLIDSIGTDRFARTLFAAAHEMTRTHHLSAFFFAGRSRPRTLLAENSGQNAVSRRIAQLYAERYWHYDLANDVTSKPNPGLSTTWCVRTSASEIAQDDYKSQCYTSAGLAKRICVSQCDDDREIRLNFYSPCSRSFLESEINSIVGWSDIFLTMLAKHDSIARTEEQSVSEGYAERLRRLRAGLPPREVDICDGILRGITSEGIALRLNVSINTVRTYRKRAYARLGISSQNELMRLVSH
jgi:LuxR family transcriptional regulator, activator of tox operons